METRLANQRDMNALCALYTELYQYNSAQQPAFYNAAAETGAYPQSVLSRPDGAIFIAEQDGKIVGFTHLEEESTSPYPMVASRKFVHVVDLYVQHEWRGQGVGKLLLREAKNWAGNRGAAYLELLVLEENRRGRRFYARENFCAASRTLRYML